MHLFYMSASGWNELCLRISHFSLPVGTQREGGSFRWILINPTEGLNGGVCALGGWEPRRLQSVCLLDPAVLRQNTPYYPTYRYSQGNNDTVCKTLGLFLSTGEKKIFIHIHFQKQLWVKQTIFFINIFLLIMIICMTNNATYNNGRS